jgi:hypothetical protein
MDTRFIIKVNGVESGPFTAEQLKALVVSGELSPTTPIRSERLHRRWLPTDFAWFPVRFLCAPISLSDIRIPRSSVPHLVIYGSLLLAALCMAVLRMLHKW